MESIMRMSAVLVLAAAAVSSAPAADDSERRVVEAQRIIETAVSPNGQWLAYSVLRGSVQSNRYTTELLLRPVPSALSRASEGAGLSIAKQESDTGSRFAPRWSGGVLTYLSETDTPARLHRLMKVDPVDAQRSAIQTKPVFAAPLATPAEHAHCAHIPAASTGQLTDQIGADYAWSPDLRFVAFTVVLARPLDPRAGTLVSTQWRGPAARKALVILDAQSGRIEQCSPASLHVVGFDWSPDGAELVLAATPDKDADGVPVVRTDLLVMQRSSAELRMLVERPGLDGAPSWSPDGQWIAFSTHHGQPTYRPGDPALVPADGGEVLRISGTDIFKPALDEPMLWSADSRSFYYPSYYAMTHGLVRVDIETRVAIPVITDDSSYKDSFSVSADNRVLAFTRESTIAPPELYVRDMVSGATERMSERPTEAVCGESVSAREISWLSSKDQLQLHGLLLTPSTPPNGQRPGPLPTLVFLHGGPSMVRRSFLQDGRPGVLCSLAAHGYVVFAPNTRGRGGYGEATQDGIRAAGGSGQAPYQDVIDGLSQLKREGVADEKRLGIIGHSYGGYLTAYALTQTRMFRAAVISEGGPFERLSGMVNAAPGSDWAILMRDMHGVSNPFDPPERARIIEQSPLLHAQRIRTPTLLLYGAQAVDLGWPLYQSLQRFGTPSALAVYAEGHVFQRPAAVADSLRRTREWMDQWIGQPN